MARVFNPQNIADVFKYKPDGAIFMLNGTDFLRIEIKRVDIH